MHKPKVSVIMAVWNDEENIRETVESIINQTFKDWEFIIVQDGSDDRTPEILEELAKKDKRIRVLDNEKRMERCFSRNRAISETKGEYIAVNDGDDISLPERLEKEVNYLDAHSNCYLIGARAYLVNEKGKKIGESWGTGEDSDITRYMEEKNRLVHSSVMFRNTHEYKYRDKFLYAQDYDLFLQMMANGKEIHLLNDFLVVYTTKENLVYNSYLLRQTYSAEMAKYIYRKKKYEGKDIYDEIDEKNIEQYVPENIVLEMNMKRAFFDKNYKEARVILKKMIKKQKKLLWICFYIDTFSGGILYKIVRTLKRFILY
jgi:glycosyltransferase involved in cell wall biosynthesis